MWVGTMGFRRVDRAVVWCPERDCRIGLWGLYGLDDWDDSRWTGLGDRGKDEGRTWVSGATGSMWLGEGGQVVYKVADVLVGAVLVDGDGMGDSGILRRII